MLSQMLLSLILKELQIHYFHWYCLIYTRHFEAVDNIISILLKQKWANLGFPISHDQNAPVGLFGVI